MNKVPAPSLLNTPINPRLMAEPLFTAHCLMNLMYDGFYALFMLKNRCAPQDETTFSVKTLDCNNGVIGLNWSLSRATEASINGYNDVIQLAPPCRQHYYYVTLGSGKGC